MAINRHNDHNRRGTSATDSSSNTKNNRDTQADTPGANNRASGNFGKGKSNGGNGGFGKGFKSNGNTNDGKEKGNTDDSSNSNNGSNSNKGGNNNSNNSNGKGGNDNNGSKSSSSSSNTNNAGSGSSNDNNNDDNGNNNGSNNSNGGNNSNSGNNSNNSNNNGNGNGGGSAATTTAASSGGDDSNDSNGAQQFSSDSVDDTTITTDAPTAAAPTTPPTTVVLTTSTIVTTGPDAVVTSFIPLITTAATADSTTSLRNPFSPFGPFGTGFPGFPTVSRPTGKDSSSSDDKKHKGINGTTTDDNNNNSNNNNKGNNNGNNNNKGNNNNNSSKSLDPTAERALISVGSIGAFIVVCFIFWLIWRAFKKQKQKKLQQGNVSSFPSHDGPFTTMSRLPGRFYNRVVNKIPFASKQRKAWQTLEETSSSNVGPTMASNIVRSQMPRAGGPTYEEKGGDTLRTFGFESDLPPAIPSQVYYSGGLGLGLQFQSPPQQTDAGSINRMPTAGLMRSNSGVSAFTHSPAASFSSSLVSAPSVMQGAVPYGANNAMPSNMGLPTGPVMVINGAGQQYLTDDISSATGTMRSRMPDPFYNQSQLARQPSDAYDPARRQVNRVSELSSLSSGFGDGEILVLPSDQQQVRASGATMVMPRAPPIPSGPPPAASSGAAGRFSWMRKQRMSRETVYTESSEDQPTKFRSVNSWVNQQTGRVRRGQASIDTTTSASAAGAGSMVGSSTAVLPGDEPGIPHPMPEEQRLTMMMDDEEVPRHPDTIPGIRTT